VVLQQDYHLRGSTTITVGLQESKVVFDCQGQRRQHLKMSVVDETPSISLFRPLGHHEL